MLNLDEQNLMLVNQNIELEITKINLVSVNESLVKQFAKQKKSDLQLKKANEELILNIQEKADRASELLVAQGKKKEKSCCPYHRQ